MFSVCRLFGLSLSANQLIPGVVNASATRRVDVRVWLGLMPPWLNSLLKINECWYRSDELDDHGSSILTIWKLARGNYFRLIYTDGTEFVVDRLGTQVWAVWPETLSLEDTATYLLGPIMGFVLGLRGTICLHASAIVIGGQAIALIGPSGAGKSTTAAAFTRLGYRVLTDDVVALTEQDSAFLVQPGYPRLRLWPQSVSALYGATDALPCLTPNWDKRYLDLIEHGDRFQSQPLPLAAIYLLGERRDDPGAPLVEAVPGSERLMSLVANTYATKLMDRSMRAREFEVLGRVVASVPVRRVIPHTNTAYLPNLCEVIVKDFQRLS
jgi:hypothetical protein